MQAGRQAVRKAREAPCTCMDQSSTVEMALLEHKYANLAFVKYHCFVFHLSQLLFFVLHSLVKSFPLLNNGLSSISLALSQQSRVICML